MNIHLRIRGEGIDALLTLAFGIWGRPQAATADGPIAESAVGESLADHRA
ncbi:hypothetical protein [Microvirga rosea]|nr:hypothetical protein [Microvirga rosea]MCB8823167.1 hypothetical protein [Microvirga rosea]